MRHIAILSVHGVADQKMRVTARNTAGLLLSDPVGQHYSTFEQKDIRVGINTLELTREVSLDDTKAKSLGDRFNQKSRVSKSLEENRQIEYKTISMQPEMPRAKSANRQEPLDDSEQVEHELMREQLQEYEVPAADMAFDTIMLRGKRYQDKKAQACEVDVYEAYWADQSRLKSGLFTVFFEFYLFLFFFSRVGGITLEYGSRKFNYRGLWGGIEQSHKIAELALVLGVPISYLAIFTLSVTGLPYLLLQKFDLGGGVADGGDLFHILFVLMTGGLAIIGGGALLYANRYKVKSKHWYLLFLLILFTTTMVATLANTFNAGVRGVVFLSWVLAAAAVFYLCWHYEKRRPGAFYIGSLMLAIAGAVLLFELVVTAKPGEPEGELIYGMGMQATQVVLVFNLLSWILFVAATAVTSVFGWILKWRAPGREQVEVGRAVWTGVLSLILPGILTLLISLSLWQVLIKISSYVLDPELIEKSSALTDQHILPYFSWIVAVLVLAAAYAVWAISPAPLSELTRNPKASLSRTAWLGEALSNAFKRMRLSGEVIRYVLILIIPLSWLYLQFHEYVNLPAWSPDDVPRRLIFVMGVITLIMFFGSRGPFRFFAFGFRAGLDIALDVANWLRVRPLQATPRAVITSRFTSLLRHIAGFTDENDGEPYSAVVIMAHSQGTVITSDILRFMKREYGDGRSMSPVDPLKRLYIQGNGHLPVYLMTFGSPLRQLYSLRFPYQYSWAGEKTGTAESGAVLHGPDPCELGVVSWTNLYFSGDYVGRYLWIDDNDEYKWDTTKWSDERSTSTYANVREKCLGYGAHLQYWKGAVDDIAEVLDDLVVKGVNVFQAQSKSPPS